MKYFLVILCCLSCSLIFSTNRALIVGIGDYDTEKTGWGKLHGDKDVDILLESLNSVGFERSNIKTLKNAQATKKEIIKSLKELSTKVQQGDKVIFHFSGHGQPVKDLNGDEENGLDESIVPYDAYRSTKYKIELKDYQGENHILDDELFPLFYAIKKKVGNQGYFLITIDACYSRGIEMDAMGDLTPEEQKRVAGIRGTDQILKVNENSPLVKIAKPTGYEKNGKMTVISACREDERNFEYQVPDKDAVYGSLTYTICHLLGQGKSFSDIEKYFSTKAYSSDKIFSKNQHPKIKIY